MSAEVAELVDALGSGSSGRMPVEVRVFSSAPSLIIARNLYKITGFFLAHSMAFMLTFPTSNILY